LIRVRPRAPFNTRGRASSPTWSLSAVRRSRRRRTCRRSNTNARGGCATPLARLCASATSMTARSRVFRGVLATHVLTNHRRRRSDQDDGLRRGRDACRVTVTLSGTLALSRVGDVPAPSAAAPVTAHSVRILHVDVHDVYGNITQKAGAIDNPSLETFTFDPKWHQHMTSHAVRTGTDAHDHVRRARSHRECRPCPTGFFRPSRGRSSTSTTSMP
jgi:hypothetical protein